MLPDLLWRECGPAAILIRPQFVIVCYSSHGKLIMENRKIMGKAIEKEAVSLKRSIKARNLSDSSEKKKTTDISH